MAFTTPFSLGYSFHAVRGAPLRFLALATGVISLVLSLLEMIGVGGLAALSILDAAKRLLL